MNADNKSIIGMINQSSGSLAANARVQVLPEVLVTSILNLTFTQILVDLKLSNHERILSGQYIELTVKGIVMRYSIFRHDPTNNVVTIIVGGSSLSRSNIDLLEHLKISKGKGVTYSIKGGAVCRIVGSRPVLMIASGSALSHAYPILVEHVSTYMKMTQEGMADQLPNIHFIWACKGVHEVFAISEMLHKIDEDFPSIKVSILVESIGYYDESILESRKLIKSSLPSYVDQLNIESGDLFNHLIYLSGSNEMVHNISHALVDKYKADRKKIVSDLI